MEFLKWVGFNLVYILYLSVRWFIDSMRSIVILTEDIFDCDFEDMAKMLIMIHIIIIALVALIGVILLMAGLNWVDLLIAIGITIMLPVFIVLIYTPIRYLIGICLMFYSLVDADTHTDETYVKLMMYTFVIYPIAARVAPHNRMTDVDYDALIFYPTRKSVEKGLMDDTYNLIDEDNFYRGIMSTDVIIKNWDKLGFTKDYFKESMQYYLRSWKSFKKLKMFINLK